MPNSKQLSLEFTKIDQTDHSPKELAQLKKLLCYVMRKAGLSGSYKLMVSSRGKTGSSHVKGLMIGTTTEIGVLIYYQPAGNDSRRAHTLVVDPEHREMIQGKLANICPKALLDIPKKKALKKSAIKSAVPVPQLAKSQYFIENFSVTNQEHALAFVEVAQQKAKEFIDAVLPRAEMSKLLAAFAGREPFAIGPFKNSLVSRGYLIPFGDGFLVKTEDLKPAKSYRRKSAQTPTLTASKPASKAKTVSLSKRLYAIAQDQPLMLQFFESCLKGFGNQEYISSQDLHVLMSETFSLDLSRRTWQGMVKYLVRVKKLEQVGYGQYRLSQQIVDEILSRSDAAVNVALSTPPKMREISLSKPMKKALDDTEKLIAFAQAFNIAVENASYLDSHKTHELVMKYLLPSGTSTWAFNQFSRSMVECEFLAKEGRSKFTLGKYAIALLEKQSATQAEPTASQSPRLLQNMSKVSADVSPEDVDSENEILAKAVRDKRRLKDELAKESQRADEAEAQLPALQNRVGELEAQLNKQPDIAQLVQESVAAELKRLLEEE